LSRWRRPSLDRVDAIVLVHHIKESPGGWKLSMEMIAILAVAFEDCYLPGDTRVKEETLQKILHEWDQK